MVRDARGIADKVHRVLTNAVIAEGDAHHFEEHIGVVHHAGEERFAAAHRGEDDVRSGVRGDLIGNVAGDEKVARRVALERVLRIAGQRRRGRNAVRGVLEGEQVRDPIFEPIGVAGITDEHAEIDIGRHRIAVGGDRIFWEASRFERPNNGIAQVRHTA